MLHNQIDRRNSIEGSAFDTTRLSYCDAAFLVFWCRTPDTIIQTVVCETRLDLGSKRALKISPVLIQFTHSNTEKTSPEENPERDLGAMILSRLFLCRC
ncbi:hypothetical protein RRG08_045819 [Elysia crispata]|uniref:Uncharacterized protein n=1 Tax=Elysia crispata TaxID=231223 RepID=A0AAE0YZ01_9GAST|nr:hypothetical protein RRG08_045819 [Elysia crispata]